VVAELLGEKVKTVCKNLPFQEIFGGPGDLSAVENPVWL
jgi:hypothetical protein